MVIELSVEGKATQAGERYELSAYSVTEESTPTVGGDSSGGTGQISFSAVDNGLVRLFNRDIQISDQSNGKVRGTVNSISANNGIANIVADSSLGRLNANRTIAPYVGTLGGALEYYVGLAGVPAGDLLVDSTLASRPVVVPGWNGTIWDFLKQLCVAEQFEISEVSNYIVIRGLRQRELYRETDSEVSWSVANTQQARKIEVYNYNTRYGIDSLIYPLGGWSDEVQPLQVDAGKVAEYDFEVNGSLISVQQPVAVDSVPPSYDTSSVYTITGNDNRPITAAQWRAQGGKVTVEINDDLKSIHITIVGAREEKYGPYRLAMTAGDGSLYSSLRIVGTGVLWNKELITLRTGASDEDTAVEVGVTIDNPCITDYAKAYTVGMSAADRYAGAQQNLSVSSSVVNRPNETGIVYSPTFAEFNAVYGAMTFAEFNTAYGALTFEEFNELLYAMTDDRFENQAFGNVVGSRVLENNAYYRSRSATITPGGISYSAERDTTFNDFNSVWAGRTFADFNAVWAGERFSDFTVQPLKKE